MKYKFLVRLDDLFPACNLYNWNLFIDSFRQNDVLCIVGIIPANMDETLKQGNEDIVGYKELLEKIKNCDNIVFAQHGYKHVISKNVRNPYLSPFSRAEFSDDENVSSILSQGQEVLKSMAIDTDIYMAPAHGLSIKHLDQIKDIGFKIITDGFSLRPYIHRGIRFIPQQLWRFRKLPFGTWTICYHPNNMTESQILAELKKISNSTRFRIKNVSELKFVEYGLVDRIFGFIFSFLLKYVKN